MIRKWVFFLQIDIVPFIKVAITIPPIQLIDIYNCNEYRHIAFI